MRLLPLALALLFACSSPQTPDNQWQEILGRDEGEVRRPVYRVLVPVEWERIETRGSVLDSTLPLVTYFFDGLTIHIHSFPCMPIPPEAQVERWARQCKGPIRVEPVAHGGYYGLYLQNSQMLAFALSLDRRHSLTLSRFDDPHFEQMGAPATIKVIGPSDRLRLHRTDIEAFARSFELIQEIPCAS